MPAEEQGIKILGTPIGHPEYVRIFLVGLTDEHQTLLNRISLVGDVQAVWLLLVHCAAARATYSLRCVDPAAVEGFARRHDQDMMECLSSILHTNFVDWSDEARDIATLPMSLGGLGVRSAVRTSRPAHWASWADCLAMVQERHPDVASLLVSQLAHPTTPCLQAVARVARDLTEVGGFAPPSWRELATGARPEAREPEHFEPGCTRDGRQHEVASRVEETFRAEYLFTRMDDPGKALLRCRVGTVHMSGQQTDEFYPPAVPCRSAPSLAPSSSPDRA